MATEVRVAAIGPRAIHVDPQADPASITDEMIAFWRGRFDQVLPDKPDLIVVPEACDRPGNLDIDRRLEYYRYRGDRILDEFREIADSANAYVIYSAAREHGDGTWRNASVLIGRDGEIEGVYHKNHVMVEETTQAGILCGKSTPVFQCDFGTIACAICFDLNFDEIREAYAAQSPDLICFSSMYHGGMMQQFWAYSCRSYFVGAICGLPCEVRNPYGEVVARSTNYHDHVVADINLDYRIAHLDYNRDKFSALKNEYGDKVEIYDPGFVGSVLITSRSQSKNADDIAREFDIELLDDYFDRARSHRAANIEP